MVHGGWGARLSRVQVLTVTGVNTTCPPTLSAPHLKGAEGCAAASALPLLPHSCFEGGQEPNLNPMYKSLKKLKPLLCRNNRYRDMLKT